MSTLEPCLPITVDAAAGFCQLCRTRPAAGVVPGSNASSPDLPPVRACEVCADRRRLPLELQLV